MLPAGHQCGTSLASPRGMAGEDARPLATVRLLLSADTGKRTWGLVPLGRRIDIAAVRQAGSACNMPATLMGGTATDPRLLPRALGTPPLPALVVLGAIANDAPALLSLQQFQRIRASRQFQASRSGRGRFTSGPGNVRRGGSADHGEDVSPHYPLFGPRTHPAGSSGRQLRCG